MSDTVLATIGAHRTVTLSAFRRAWAQISPPARPDSLTPQGARQFLELLIDKEALGERASQETRELSPAESVEVARLRDRTMMRIALDSALSETRRARAARGDAALSPEALGVAARESTTARLGVSYEENLVANLTQSFTALPRPSPDSSIRSRMGVMRQLPRVAPADVPRVVAWSSVGAYRVSDLLEAWEKLDPLFRPGVETPEQLRDLIKNGLFERALRRTATENHYERRPQVLEAVSNQREFLAVQAFVGREVYAQIPSDSATLRRLYERAPGAWTVPMRMRVFRLVLPSRGEASRMAVRLHAAADAETLAARARRQGVDYAAEISAASDSALFAAALRIGTGAVLGPDSVALGWQVIRVNEIIPARERTFAEARTMVEDAWTREEGERRIRELLRGLRKRIRVIVNDAALARLLREGIEAAAHPTDRGS